MIQFHCYPGGKKRVVTFSYDDGFSGDVRLAELFNRYGVKATFHINGSHYRGASAAEKAEARRVYAGHEISCHTVRHGWMDKMPASTLINEIMEDRRILEDVAGYPVVGMSYPCGAYTAQVEQAARACGILYSRTTQNTRGYGLPEDFLAWHPTCHHKDALALAENYLAQIDSIWCQPLFYIWGHSHELRSEDDWAYMEKLVSTLANNDKIWYATNIEIYDYLAAVRQLRVSADESILYNPTRLDVWVEHDQRGVIKIPAGETVRA